MFAMILDLVRCRENGASRKLPKLPSLLRVFVIQLERSTESQKALKGHRFDVSGGVRGSVG